MIDSKRLDEIEAFALQFDGPFVVGYVDSVDEGKELIRLARLGLWATQHGIPALRFYASGENLYRSNVHDICEGKFGGPLGTLAKEAISALPPEVADE